MKLKLTQLIFLRKMHLHWEEKYSIGIFLVNFQKWSERLYDGRLSTAYDQAASDLTYPKSQSQVIFAVRKYLLQYLGQNSMFIYNIYRYIYMIWYIYIYIYIWYYIYIYIYIYMIYIIIYIYIYKSIYIYIYIYLYYKY